MIKQILCAAILISLIQAGCFMETYCESCQHTGPETYVGSMTLEECKAACVADDSCNAIDYSKTGTSCYHNSGDELGSSSTSNYDSWVKACEDEPGYNSDCGCAINLDYKLCDCTKASFKSSCGTADDQESCNCGCGTCDELCQVCSMETYCEGCDYSGSETFAGTMTLEECKAACMADDSCTAIDYSKPEGTNCYLNFGSVQQHGSSGSYDAWVKSCGMPDCNGVVNGGATIDQCGVCGGDDACVDCNGVANGGAVVDDCGECGADNASLDDCGVCFGDNACVDCNGVAYGGAVFDDCGECGGDGSSCACKNPTSCKGVTQEECEASPEVCLTIIKKDVFKKCKPNKPLMCKSQETREACEALCYCEPKMKTNKPDVFKKCKDKDPADY